MFKLTSAPSSWRDLNAVPRRVTYTLHLTAPGIAGLERLGIQSYSGIVCPSSSNMLNPSVVIAAQKMGAALDDMSLTWGSVDGVRLAVMKREWLYDGYQKIHAVHG